jgi:hypothetical protein
VSGFGITAERWAQAKPVPLYAAEAGDVIVGENGSTMVLDDGWAYQLPQRRIVPATAAGDSPGDLLRPDYGGNVPTVEAAETLNRALGLLGASGYPQHNHPKHDASDGLVVVVGWSRNHELIGPVAKRHSDPHCGRYLPVVVMLVNSRMVAETGAPERPHLAVIGEAGNGRGGYLTNLVARLTYTYGSEQLMFSTVTFAGNAATVRGQGEGVTFTADASNGTRHIADMSRYVTEDMRATHSAAPDASGGEPPFHIVVAIGLDAATEQQIAALTGLMAVGSQARTQVLLAASPAVAAAHPELMAGVGTRIDKDPKVLQGAVMADNTGHMPGGWPIDTAMITDTELMDDLMGRIDS